MNVVCIICCVSTAIFTAHAACKSKSSLTSFERAALDAHNKLRRLHKDTPDLCYGESGSDIAFYSQTWAEQLASEDSFYHSTSSQYFDRRNPYGENLAWRGGLRSGTPLGGSISEAYKFSIKEGWYDEIVDWDFATSSKFRSDAVVGHFTQVVWKETGGL